MICESFRFQYPRFNVTMLNQWISEYVRVQTTALEWAKGGAAEQSIFIKDTHYGRVGEAQMQICHLLCYAFIEHPGWAK
jgi:D-sedoheptulose 7-phosphate isomerase